MAKNISKKQAEKLLAIIEKQQEVIDKLEGKAEEADELDSIIADLDAKLKEKTEEVETAQEIIETQNKEIEVLVEQPEKSSTLEKIKKLKEQTAQ